MGVGGRDAQIHLNVNAKMIQTRSSTWQGKLLQTLQGREQVRSEAVQRGCAGPCK